jgi:hypothetical protein
MTITGFMKTSQFVQKLLGAAKKWIKTRRTYKNRHDVILKTSWHYIKIAINLLPEESDFSWT